MSNWLNRTTKQLVSVSPRDMETRFGGSFVDGEGNAQSNADWIYNPDLKAVEGQSTKYWVVSGDAVSLADKAVRDSVDASETDANKDATVSVMDQPDDYLRAFALVVLDEVNILRGVAKLQPRTLTQLKTAVKNKLGS